MPLIQLTSRQKVTDGITFGAIEHTLVGGKVELDSNVSCSYCQVALSS